MSDEHPKEKHPNYPVKDLEADEEYDQPQYNGDSATHPKNSTGLEEASGSRDGLSDEGLSLKAYLTHTAPDGDPIRKTPKGIGSDGPDRDPDVNHVKAEVTSPLSGKVIIRHFEDGSTDRFICPKCAAYVAKKGDSHAMDPIFYWGAGIYHHDTQKTPKGTKGYLDREAMGMFIKYMDYSLKNNWKDITGLSFPYLYLQEIDDE